MKIKIQDPDLEYHLFHRRVKYARIEIKNGDIHLIMPHGADNHEEVIRKNLDWIAKKLSRLEVLQQEAQSRPINFNRTDQEFRDLVTSYMERKLNKMKLRVNKVSFRKMKSRWGSCSGEKNISINTHLKYLPKRLIEYVVFHELAHLIERKHDKNFWKIMAQEYPDYKKMENELSVYWLRVREL
ncbi:MAG TPA: M48 family metallopeptidase [Methanobacteriaceae archaeon]|nr:M48 family metallopeptidase [Methanobacteriaceae archaeon]